MSRSGHFGGDPRYSNSLDSVNTDNLSEILGRETRQSSFSRPDGLGIVGVPASVPSRVTRRNSSTSDSPSRSNSQSPNLSRRTGNSFVRDRTMFPIVESPEEQFQAFPDSQVPRSSSAPRQQQPRRPGTRTRGGTAAWTPKGNTHPSQSTDSFHNTSRLQTSPKQRHHHDASPNSSLSSMESVDLNSLGKETRMFRRGDSTDSDTDEDSARAKPKSKRK